MEQENGKIIEGEIHYPSHFGEVYDAMPEKFEKRKNLKLQRAWVMEQF